MEKESKFFLIRKKDTRIGIVRWVSARFAIYQIQIPLSPNGKPCSCLMCCLPFPGGCSWMSHCHLEQLVLALPFQQFHTRTSKTAKNNRNSKCNALGNEDLIRETAEGNWTNHRQAVQVVTMNKMVSVLFYIIFLAASRSWNHGKSGGRNPSHFHMINIRP